MRDGSKHTDRIQSDRNVVNGGMSDQKFLVGAELMVPTRNKNQEITGYRRYIKKNTTITKCAGEIKPKL